MYTSFYLSSGLHNHQIVANNIGNNTAAKIVVVFRTVTYCGSPSLETLQYAFDTSRIPSDVWQAATSRLGPDQKCWRAVNLGSIQPYTAQQARAVTESCKVQSLARGLPDRLPYIRPHRHDISSFSEQS